MNVRGIVVCVNYSDLLVRSLDRWHMGLDRLVVVTAPKDKATQEYCRHFNIETHVTNIFYENGAKFNKGAALSEAIIKTDLRYGADWLLTFDADIVPPLDWREEVSIHCPFQKGTLYGARRWMLPEQDKALDPSTGKLMPQGWVLGFFMLFHAQDKNLGKGAIFDLCWPHAGNYDTTFCRRWPRPMQEILPLKLIHLGEERVHWTGRGRKAELYQSFLGKRKGYEDWERERMTNVPKIK